MNSMNSLSPIGKSSIYAIAVIALAASASAVSAAAFDQMDVKPFENGGPLAPNGKIYTAGHSDAYGTDTSVTHAFGYYFSPPDSGGGVFSSNPGFNATDGSLPYSVKTDFYNGVYTVLYVNVLTSLTYWDGTGDPTFTSAVPNGTHLSFQNPSGSVKYDITPTSGAAGGFSLGTTGVTSSTTYGGGIHKHSGASLLTGTQYGGPDGFYAFELSIVLGKYSTVAGVSSPIVLDETTRSDPFYVVFHQATPSILYSSTGDPPLDSAVAALNASLVPEPASVGLTAVAAVGLLQRRRRHA